MPDREEMRTIAYRCPHCRQTVIAERTLFAMAAAPTRIPCPCGKSELAMEFLSNEVKLSVPCPFCEREHQVFCDAGAFMGEKMLAFSCAASGLTCLCVGEKQAVYAAAARMEQAADKLEREQSRQPEERQSFLDDIIMHEVLSELRDIAARGGISCTCGSREWDFQVNYSSVELMCRACHARLRIPASTADDLDDLCCKTKLLIHGRGEADEEPV